MMRIPKYFLAVIAVLCFFTFQSCKKSSAPAPDPTPAPVIKPDTLTAGWTKQVLPGTPALSDIFFNSATSGYISGQYIYKSADGGLTWPDIATANGVFNLFVTNNNKAFFVGGSNYIRRTIDGGSTFTNTSITDMAIDIFFIDNTAGYCITPSGLYTTGDAGDTWTKIITTGLPVFASGYASLYFVNNTTGWVVTPQGIFKTTGTIANWQQAATIGGNGSGIFQSLYATSVTNIFAANTLGEIFRSTDGGANFSFLKKLDEGGFTDIHFLSNLVGYASAGTHIYKTTDGGVNWNKVVSLGQGTLSEIHFTDTNHGWACGSDGIVLTFKP